MKRREQKDRLGKARQDKLGRRWNGRGWIYICLYADEERQRSAGFVCIPVYIESSRSYCGHYRSRSQHVVWSFFFFPPPSPTSREANSFDSILQSLWSIIPSIILYKLLAARYTYIEYKSSIKKKSYTSVLKWFFFFSILRFLERINFVCVVDRIRHLSHRKSNPPLWWISLSALWPLLLIVPVLFCVSIG